MQQRALYIYPHRIYSFKFQKVQIAVSSNFLFPIGMRHHYLENKFLIITKSERDLGLSWWSSGWFCSPNAGGLGLIPGQGTRSHMLQIKIPHATTKTWQSQINIFLKWKRPGKHILKIPRVRKAQANYKNLSSDHSFSFPLGIKYLHPLPTMGKSGHI